LSGASGTILEDRLFEFGDFDPLASEPSGGGNEEPYDDEEGKRRTQSGLKTYNNPDGSVTIVLQDGRGRFDSTGTIYVGGTGMVFGSFQSCVDYYAQQSADAKGDFFSSFGPVGWLIDMALESIEPTAADIEAAAAQCN
jgi:hypothetical protein